MSRLDFNAVRKNLEPSIPPTDSAGFPETTPEVPPGHFGRDLAAALLAVLAFSGGAVVVAQKTGLERALDNIGHRSAPHQILHEDSK